MKLWDSLTTCLILLSAVYASPLLQSPQQPTSTKRRGRVAESPPELPPAQIGLSVSSTSMSRADTANRDETLAGGDKCEGSESAQTRYVICNEICVNCLKT